MTGTAPTTANGRAPANDMAEINRALDLFRENGVVELRHIGPGWRGRKETRSGYFDDFDLLAQEASACESGNVYLTLNPVDESLLARRSNRVAEANTGDLTGDGHISRRRHLLVDFDANRASGISATDDEHDRAIEVAKRAGKALVDSHGFPRPVLADSGNGAHLLFRIDLPNDDASTLLVQRVLARMEELFGDDSVKIDQTVYNAARITKAYGTAARKGDHTHDRPHRLSRLLFVPKSVEAVTREQLEAFAGPAEVETEKPAPRQHRQSFDVEAFLAQHLEITSHGPHTDTRGAEYRWKLATCPFCGESDKSAVVLRYQGGKLGFKCHHDRCFGIGWKELREHFEPGYRDAWKESSAHPPAVDLASFGPIPKPTEKPPTYQRITCKELAQGDYALDYLIEGTMVAGQPLIIAGPQKTLKTSFIVDAAISLATGGYFLGRLKVPSAVRVAVMSGESGLATLQETAFRISAKAGWHLCDIDNLIWSPDIPKFGDGNHLVAMDQFLSDDEVSVVFVDPAYLALPSQDSGNLIAQGELLRGMSALCERMGVTMVLAHHTKKNTLTPKDEPPELSDIAWAGFAEFARQWWLIGRREKYQPGTGDHKLWLSVGGSAGHSALWGVDVSEGVYSPLTPRTWNVEVRHGHDVLGENRESEAEQRQRRSEERAVKQAASDREAIVGAMAKLGRPETKSMIRDAALLSGKRANSALAQLEADGMVRRVTVERSNNQKYEGFELCQE